MPEQSDKNRRQLASLPLASPALTPATLRARRRRSFPTPNCIAKRTSRFSKVPRIPTSCVYRAAELGYSALAITDRNSLAGVVRARAAAKQAGLKLLIGAELTPVDAPAVVLLATDRKAYGRLSRLITVGWRTLPKGNAGLRSMILPVMPKDCSAGIVGERDDRRSVALSRSLRRSLLLAGGACIAGRTMIACLTQRIQLARQSRAAAGGRQRRAFSSSVAPGAGRRADCDAAGCTVAEAGERAVSQRRAASEIAGRNARAVRPRAGCRAAHASRSPTAARFRSTSCATNIPRNWPRRARRRSSI